LASDTGQNRIAGCMFTAICKRKAELDKAIQTQNNK